MITRLHTTTLSLIIPKGSYYDIIFDHDKYSISFYLAHDVYLAV
jgi:hypothetical protein